jgi:hypothetical protein
VVMRHHRPEAAQGLGRGADSELREIAFQEGLQEGAAPLEALRLAGGEERPRKSPRSQRRSRAAGPTSSRAKPWSR